MNTELSFSRKLRDAREGSPGISLDGSDPEQVGAKFTLENIAENEIWKTAIDEDLADLSFSQAILSSRVSNFFAYGDIKNVFDEKFLDAYKKRALLKNESLPDDLDILKIGRNFFEEMFRKHIRKNIVESSINYIKDINEPAQVVGAVEKVMNFLEPLRKVGGFEGAERISPNQSITQNEILELEKSINDIIDLNLNMIEAEGKNVISGEMLQEKLQQTIQQLRDLIDK